MRNYNLQVKCTICGDAEIITSNDPTKTVNELMSEAYQADETKINPYFKLPNRVLSGMKGDPNWVYIPLCQTCRDLWDDSVLPELSQTLNDFITGGGE